MQYVSRNGQNQDQKMTKSEIEQNAEEYVKEKADKGNYDTEQFGKAYFSESSLKQAHIAGALSRQPEIDEAKEIIKRLHDCLLQDDSDEETRHYIIEYMTEAEQFLGE